jgi:coiled-coil domain-containing protein 55
MNISLGAAKGKKKEAAAATIGFGLNARGAKKAPKKNVFGDDDDDEEERAHQEEPPRDARAMVNQALRKEQEALRQRAKKSMEAQAEIYDYDGAYESFSKQPDAKEGGGEAKKSRYIGELLKTAQDRKLDRDIAMERKVAREQQQEEEDNIELRGKERFVTASYKRKLEERKLWQDEQNQRHKKEEDVTQKEGGMSNFYGNLTQNVAMGGATKDDSKATAEAKKDDKEDTTPGLGFMDGFESVPDNSQEEATKASAAADSSTTKPGQKQPIDPETARQERRMAREEKVAQARIRYTERHAIEAK